MCYTENTKAVQRAKKPNEIAFHLDYATAGHKLRTLMREKHPSGVRFFKNF